MSWEELDFILRNEELYRRFIDIHFNESFIGDDLGVQNNTFGNSKEKTIVNKLEDKEYKKAYIIVKTFNKFSEEFSDVYIFIYRYRFKQGMSIPQIARKINYSESTVKKKIRKIRNYFEECLKCLEYPI